METYLDPKIKACRDFHRDGVKNNTYTTRKEYEAYEAEWRECFDHESRMARAELEGILV